VKGRTSTEESQFCAFLPFGVFGPLTCTFAEGRVVYLAKLRGGDEWTVVQEWVPAACLIPD
jgi:hypothetical protein